MLIDYKGSKKICIYKFLTRDSAHRFFYYRIFVCHDLLQPGCKWCDRLSAYLLSVLSVLLFVSGVEGELCFEILKNV